MDYEENNGKALDSIFQYIIKKKHFDMVSIYNFGVNDKLLRILNGLHFKTNSMAQKIERLLKGEFPLLIRPVNKKLVENDWFIEGLNIRNIDNWEIKPIGSDAA